MRIQDNIGLISWSLADKGLYFLNGVVMILIINAIDPGQYGLYGLLISLHTWIFILSDSFALVGIIQFGMNTENTRKVNTIALLFHILITFGGASIIYLIQVPLSHFFKEPKIIDIANYLPMLCLSFIPRTYCIKMVYKELNMKKLFIINLTFFGVTAILTLAVLYLHKRISFNELSNIYIIGAIFSSIISVIITYKQLIFGIAGKIRIKEIVRFGLQIFTVNAIHSLPKQLDVYLIKFFFNIEVVGVYTSAKVLFRAFDELLAAAMGLVYPAALRQIEKKNNDALMSLMVKTVSMLFISFTFLFILMELGLSKYLIHLIFSTKYLNAIPQFNLMIISLPFFAFIVFYAIIQALNKLTVTITYVSISLVVSFVTLYIIGRTANPIYISLGIVSYNVTLGILSLFFAIKYLNFKFVNLISSISDIKNFSISFLKKIRTKL